MLVSCLMHTSQGPGSNTATAIFTPRHTESWSWRDRCLSSLTPGIRGAMSESMAGGLVPLGPRAGPGNGGSKATLSGGLIPLGNKSRPTANFERGTFEDEEERPNVEGRNRGWDYRDDDDDSVLRKSRRPPSSSKRRGSKDRKSSDDVNESSSHGKSSRGNSRRRRGSRETSKDHVDYADANDDDHSLIGGLGGSSGRTKDRGKSLAAVDAVRADDEEEDDTYLFLGATAGAKAKKSSVGGATERALDYDSTDSFGLPKPKTKKGRPPGVTSKPSTADSDLKPLLSSSYAESRRPSSGLSAIDGATGEASVVCEHDGLISGVGGCAMPGESAKSKASSSNTTMDSGGGDPLKIPTATAPQEEASKASTGEAVPATVGTGIDLDDDFDSPDEEMDALLKMTDPSSFTTGRRGASPSASASASAIGSESAPIGGKTSRQEAKESSEPAPGTTDPWPAGDSGKARGFSAEEPLRRRSPSPPSSPRNSRSDGLQGHFSGESPSSRRGRGLFFSGSRDDLKGGRVSEKKMENVPHREGGFHRDASPRVTHDLDAGMHQAVAGADAPSRLSSVTGESGAGGDALGGSAARMEGSGQQAPDSTTKSGYGIYEDDSTNIGRGGGSDNGQHHLTSSGPGVVLKGDHKVPRRSALAGTDKSRSSSRNPKSSRGVTFDDDLVGVDALDILPGSSTDEDEKARSDSLPTPVESPKAASLITDPSPAFGKSSVQQSPLSPAKRPSIAAVVDGDGDIRETNRKSSTRVASSSSAVRRSSEAMTEGLSPAAARLIAEDSSSEDNGGPKASGSSNIGSLLGLGVSGAAASVGQGQQKNGGRAKDLGNIGTKDGDEDKVMTTTEDAKLDLALGFTPSAMEGGRKPRRTLAAGRRRRSRGDGPPLKAEAESTRAGFLAADMNRASTESASTSVPVETELKEDKIATQQKNVREAQAIREPTAAAVTAAAMMGVTPTGKSRDGDAEGSRSSHVSGLSPTLPSPASMSAVQTLPAATAGKTPNESSSSQKGLPSASLASAVSPSASAPGIASSTTVRATTTSHSNASNEFDGRAVHETNDNNRSNNSNGSTSNSVNVTTNSEAEKRVESRVLDDSVITSLERQLVLLAGEKEELLARSARDEKKFQADADQARETAAAAQARAFESETALAAARAQILQLEAEGINHSSHLAAVESRTVSEIRAEQESCLKKISDAETRHQDDLRQAETRHAEALAELKRLHKEEIEDMRRRNSDSKTLEALAGQVQASAGAVKLLQSKMMERQNVSEVSREGHMEARERLIKDLEHSARRAQQTAEDEIQRLQGTLMAMDQVMSALRGQNAGERERLRQEHMRMEALQGAMVAEVEAMRKSVEEERQRLADRCAALEREKREASAAARAESDRLAEERVKLETEREKFAALQVSASQAAQEIARRHAREEEMLQNARQSLQREASSLEARLTAAREDLHKADHVRDSLDRLRDQDELERRRLKTLAGELERALEEVRMRTEDSEERWREAERMKTESLAASKIAIKEREASQLRAVEVEEVARRLEAERTTIAQARAQSATELSTSRRLKAELSRAFAIQQRQHPKVPAVATGAALSSCTAPLGPGFGGGDSGAGIGVDIGRQMFGGGAVSATTQGLHPEITSGLKTATAVGSGFGRDISSPPPPPDTAAGGVGIPFTGIAAAEATLQVISSAPPFPGLDVGKELGRLSRRAADLRLCTREQSAFLSSSRAARLSSTSHEPTTATAAKYLEASDTFAAANVGQSSGDGTTGRGGVGTLGIGLSGTVKEELDKIEEACLQRSSALKEEEPFVDSLGRAEIDGAVLRIQGRHSQV